MGDKLVKQDIAFKGRIFSVYSETWKTETGDILKRDVCQHKDAVSVLPITERKTVFLVKQMRHAIRESLLEIPAGLIEEGEKPEDCLRRELLEETGCVAKKIRKLAIFHSSPGFTNEKIHLYVALAEKTSDVSLEADEELTVYEFDRKVAEEMVFSGEIRDAKTIIAILLARNLRIEDI